MPAVNSELETIAANLRRSTVQIRGRGRRAGTGSGVIWQADGLIVTNAHVVRGTEATVELADGQTYRADVVQRDNRRDLAALRVKATDLPAITVGDPKALRVGDLVFAVGNPLGQVGAITMGIVHALPQSQNWLQADIRLAPGNSGGALANAQGQVIGINTLIANRLGFAVPSNVIDRFLQGGDRPYLGVTLQPVLLPSLRERRLGFLVLEVAIGSPAADSHLLVGDMIVGVAQQVLTSLEDLTNFFSTTKPGDMVQIELIRGGQQQTHLVVMQANSLGVRAA